MVLYVYVEVDMRGVLLALVVASRKGRQWVPLAIMLAACACGTILIRLQMLLI